MKVGFVGTGTMGSIERGSQSILVDNVLFDVGSGVVKKMEALKWYTKNVDYLIITHFHADHFFDIPNFLIGRNIRRENIKKLTIVGGKGLRKKIIDLLEFAFGNSTKNKYKELEVLFNVEVIELQNGDEFKGDDFKITAFELEHGDCKPILGFIFEKNGVKLGYATDTTLCENVKIIADKADYLFLDATNTVPTSMHMGIKEVIWLAKEHPEKKVYAIHRSDYVHEHISDIIFPEDGDVIEI